MLLFRAGNIEDPNLEKGNWWSNSLKRVKPYFRGKIVVIEIPLMKEEEQRFLVSKEVKKFGHHDGYGVWTKKVSDISEDLNENYYYISPKYLETYGKMINQFESINSLEEAQEIYG